MQAVVVVFAVKRVVSCAADEGIISNAAKDRVVAALSIKLIVSVQSTNCIIAVAALDGIDSRIAVDDVVTRTAKDGVGRVVLGRAAVRCASGVDRVVARSAKYGIAAFVAENRVAVTAEIIGREITIESVITGTAVLDVSSSFAEESVVPGIAKKLILAVTAEKAVGSGCGWG